MVNEQATVNIQKNLRKPAITSCHLFMGLEPNDSATGPLVADVILQLKDETKRFQNWKPTVYF